jgi:hypothetical protein
MQVDILTLETLPYFYAALSRNDLSYVAGEFRIFGAIFLKDGRSLFECHISLFELGNVRYCELLNFVGGRLILNRGGPQRFLQNAEALSLAISGAGFFWTTFFWAGLGAWGLPGIGFLGTRLFGMAEKTSALIEAKGTRIPGGRGIGLKNSYCSGIKRRPVSWSMAVKSQAVHLFHCKGLPFS